MDLLHTPPLMSRPSWTKTAIRRARARSRTAPGLGSSPQVPEPPDELRPDAHENTPGSVPKTAPVQPGASAPPSSADDEALSARPSREDRGEAPAGKIGTGKGTAGRSVWDFDTESSESSLDDYDRSWKPQKEFSRFLWDDRREEGFEKKARGLPQSISQRQRKRKMERKDTVGVSDNVYTDMSDNCKRSLTDSCTDYKDAISRNKEHSFRKKANFQSSLDSHETVVAIKQLILSTSAKKHPNGNSISEAESFSLVGGKLKQLKAEPSTGPGSEQEPSFFPCTKCNVNFKEKAHLHRHMMYHLDGHNQVRHVNAPRPFICRECGRSFRDRGSLLKHMIIHQERREKLMEEIKGLNELRDEGRNAKLQCPQCIFGTNCPKTFVQHAKTHEKDKRYYCCEECDHMALTEHELRAHLYATHRVTCEPRYGTMMKSDRSKERRTFVSKKNDAFVPLLFPCKICSFSTRNRNVLRKHVELIHQQPFLDDFESLSHDETNDYATPAFEQQFFSKSQKADSQRLQLKPRFCIQRQAFRKRTESPFWSGGIADLFIKSKSTQKARKGYKSSLSKWSLGNSTNKLSPSLRRNDKPSKLSPQQSQKIDVTTGLPYDEDHDNNRGYGSVFSGNTEMPTSLLSCYEPLTPKMESSFMYFSGYDSDSGRGDSKGLDSGHLTTPSVTKKCPSKRKMSTPYHNTTDKGTHVILPKHEQTPKRNNVSEDSSEEAYDFSDYTSEATANFLDCSENEQNPYARSYFIRRQRAPSKDGRVSSGDPFEKEEEKDGDDIQQLVVKEELIESEVSQEHLESDAGLARSDSPGFDTSPFSTERKSCPYCPAVFESGVGLSNHVRGHLHRVGLSYDARHVVSPEQVASRDCRPRIRRKIPTTPRRIRKGKPEVQTEHTCPLCGGWFDTKTGLSNHVRGHLKRIGKTVSSTSKSPVCILNEMMKDEEEYRNILQVLNNKRFLSRPFVSQKFASSDGLFLTPTGIPVKIQHAGQDAKPWGLSMMRQEEEGLEKKEPGTENGPRGTPSSTLIELLKKKKQDEELELRNHSQSTRKHFTTTPTKESSAGTQLMGWAQESREINKRVCVHCNTSFPSAVSLSNHLRAYARRKRVALLEGTSYDCKQKKPRSRPGPKKKMFMLPHTADEIYRLTCRFCDLVFQGPLSVQEDWIKHLQRHIMHTSVPHTGAGMVEVTCLPIEPLTPPNEPTPPLVPQEEP
ncbi:hypothetical protein AGOR_G00178490 [Albula goreensis]|uniref:C2H2-type domain-containing protein n=1 Tax=Albula goreensis TaxID=1534307 RepID=A0A8T3D150_9TELE|nr:hypothetical protein AGOR_G00178490 [Albula goreensis]